MLMRFSNPRTPTLIAKPMNSTRLLVIIEAAAFFSAALAHFGILINGYQHLLAARAEGVIGLVLFVGWILILARPSWTRRTGLTVQGFALLGTLVGIYTIAVGIGPRTVPDLIYHACMVVLLIFGLTIAIRARQRQDLLET